MKNAKRMGLDAAGISTAMLKEHTPVYLNRVNRLIDEVGIPIAMASAYPDFTHPDALQRERELEYLRRDIAMCSELRLQ